jgi:ribosomal protein S12 methylthiotransferase accessory factor
MTDQSQQSQIERAIALYQAALPPGELMTFDLSRADRLGVPCQSATFFDPEGRMRGGIGYGTSREAALVGALGEMTEEFQLSRGIQSQPRTVGSYLDMVRERGAQGVIDPLTLCLEAGSNYSPEMPLQWFEVQRYPSGEKVLVPIEWVACYGGDVGQNPGGAPPLITPITNGLGAGLSFEQALCHGLLELLQRDGNSVRFRALARGTAVDLDSIQDPEARAILEKLDREGVDVRLKIASTQMGLANVYAVGCDRDEREGAAPIMAVGCGEACHPVAEVAVRKALLEFCASRSRVAFCHGPLQHAAQIAPEGYMERVLPQLAPENEETRALESLLRWIAMPLPEIRELLSRRVYRVDESVTFDSLPTADEETLRDKKALLDLLVERLHAEGLQVLVADFSPPDGSVSAIKAIVPGLEVETMSYSRIGERNLLRLIENTATGDVPLAGIGEAPAGARPILLTEEATQRVGGPAWLDIEALSQVLGPLYSLYREPGRHIAPWLAEGRSSL